MDASAQPSEEHSQLPKVPPKHEDGAVPSIAPHGGVDSATNLGPDLSSNLDQASENGPDLIAGKEAGTDLESTPQGSASNNTEITLETGSNHEHDPASESDSASESGSGSGSGSGAEVIELALGSGDEADDSSDDLNDPLHDLLDELEKSMEYDADSAFSPDGERLVTVPPELAREVVGTLLRDGPVVFNFRYMITRSGDLSPAQLLAALGFRLPEPALARFPGRMLELGIQMALRYVLNVRPRLPQPRTVDEVANLIANSSNIVVVSGAGISTSLGIPDFRSDNGLYAQLEHLGLNDPQEVFDIRLFREDPSVFYTVAGKILPEHVLFSPTHLFIKMLADRGKLLRNYTQNIDNLEQRAGVPADRLVQCHGSFGTAHCVTCGYSVDGEVLYPAIRAGEIPKCPRCWPEGAGTKRSLPDEDKPEDAEDDREPSPSFGVMKPDITFFGESLPARFDNMLFEQGDSSKCDLLLCMGTSLKVAPVSEVVKVVGREVPQVYISKTPASHCTFEVSLLGPCDDIIELLCQKLDWPLEHPMARRPADMPDTEYPDGHITSDDGVYRFNPRDSVPLIPEGDVLEETEANEASEKPTAVAPI